MSAWLLLVIVALGTGMPALACFEPSSDHSCCHAAMQDCGSMSMMARECCTARPTQTPVLPENAITADHGYTVASTVASSIAELIPSNAGPMLTAIELKAPPGPSSTLSILRI